MKESFELGLQGEAIAVDYLKKCGYEIVEQRWKDHQMEIDIIAFDVESSELVSVEVKTRSSVIWGEPEDAVDIPKIRRSVRATDAYMKIHQITYPVRFDIIAIILLPGQDASINHIKDAFYPPVG